MASSERKYGGYNYEFVGPIPEDFTCPICTLVQREAHQVTCCGKIYCESCLEDLKNKGNRCFSCPCCRASLRGAYTVFPDKNAVSKIKHLSIYCTNKERGCKWVGNLKDMEEKHLPECPNEIVHCTIPCTSSIDTFFTVIPSKPCESSDDEVRHGVHVPKKISSESSIDYSLAVHPLPETCGAKVQRHQLVKHMTEECEWRQVKCPHCEEEGSYKHIFGGHEKKTCPNVLLLCSNIGCSVQIKRCLRADHHKVCPKEIVPCQFDFVGCEQILKREDVYTHDSEYMRTHLEKAVTRIKDLQQRLNKTEDLEHRLNKAERTIENLCKKFELLSSEKKRFTYSR